MSERGAGGGARWEREDLDVDLDDEDGEDETEGEQEVDRECEGVRERVDIEGGCSNVARSSCRPADNPFA